MQPMQRCLRNQSQCHRKDRRWFCPRYTGQDYDPEALHTDGLTDFIPVTGFFNLAYMPPDVTYAPHWRPLDVHETSPPSADRILIDLAPLRGAAVYALRYAWSERLLCPDEDPLIKQARRVRNPCDTRHIRHACYICGADCPHRDVLDTTPLLLAFTTRLSTPFAALGSYTH